MMADQLQTATKFHVPLRAQNLSSGQRSLVDLMREHQFGRIENMQVRGGLPVLNQEMKVVRLARLGSDATKPVCIKDVELKKQVPDLFEELGRLQDGTVIPLEFRHGIPFLVETTPTLIPARETPPAE
jgi:hypothetical protein